MSKKKMWFGTREFSTWVLPPAIEVGAPSVGWSNRLEYTNGRVGILRSPGSHKEYTMSWNLASRDALRVIMDFADGLHGTGPIYFIDPFAMDKNILPKQWATPFVSATDGVPLVETGLSRGVITAGAPSSFGYPTKQVTYTINEDSKTHELYVPIPEGHTLWVGMHGESLGAGLQAAPVSNGNNVGAFQNITALTANTDVLVSDSFKASDGLQGVVFRYGGFGTVTVRGVIAQVLRDGVSPSTGNFISGQGNSGCAFEEYPDLTAYSAALDKVGLSAKLNEVGV